jgi:hypothetical protein
VAAASPLPIDLPELDAAVEKLRRGEPLTERERALIAERGKELIARNFEAPPPGIEPVETTPEEDEELVEAMVEADADARQRRPPMEWRAYLASRGVDVPPRAG